MNGTVVRLDLEVLARICLKSEKTLHEANFPMVLNNLITIFASNRNLLESRYLCWC